MRASEKVVLLVAIAVPLVVATLGWPMFVKWVAGAPGPQATAVPPGAAATSVAAARVNQPTARPTVGAPATVQARSGAAQAAPTAAADTAAQSAATPELANGSRPAAATPELANGSRPAAATPGAGLAAGNDDPGQAVQSFYSLVSSHQFGTAAQLWSPRMRAAFPPQQNIDQRFSQTRAITLQRADVIANDNAQATVAVDLIESDAQVGQRHFVGTWRLVRGAGGWMLDQPQLQATP